MMIMIDKIILTVFLYARPAIFPGCTKLRLRYLGTVKLKTISYAGFKRNFRANHQVVFFFRSK